MAVNEMIGIELPLDVDSPRPLVGQLVERISGALARGALQEGDRLPTVRDLADLAGVHFNTVARAYRALEERGLLVARQGQGTFVAAGAAGAPELSREELLDQLIVDFLTEAHAFGFTPQQVQWEFSGYLRAWIQRGRPPARI